MRVEENRVLRAVTLERWRTQAWVCATGERQSAQCTPGGKLREVSAVIFEDLAKGVRP